MPLLLLLLLPCMAFADGFGIDVQVYYHFSFPSYDPDTGSYDANKFDPKTPISSYGDRHEDTGLHRAPGLMMDFSWTENHVRYYGGFFVGAGAPTEWPPLGDQMWLEYSVFAGLDRFLGDHFFLGFKTGFFHQLFPGRPPGSDKVYAVHRARGWLIAPEIGIKANMLIAQLSMPIIASDKGPFVAPMFSIGVAIDVTESSGRVRADYDDWGDDWSDWDY